MVFQPWEFPLCTDTLKDAVPYHSPSLLGELQAGGSQSIVPWGNGRCPCPLAELGPQGQAASPVLRLQLPPPT